MYYVSLNSFFLDIIVSWLPQTRMMNNNNKVNLLKAFTLMFVPYYTFSFSLKGDFVFDDSEAVVKNKDVSYNPLLELFSHDFWGTDISSNLSHKSYRPLTVLTFRINYYLDGETLNAHHFKVTNLILHVMCCLLVWQTYRSILGKNYPHHHSNKKSSIDVAFCSALLFAVHPVHTEVVSGIVGRADVLAGITFFLAFLFYINAVTKEFPLGKRSALAQCTLICMSVICATFSLLLKESGVTALGLCIVYEVIELTKSFSRNKTADNMKSITKISVARIVLLVLCSLVLLSLRWHVMGYSGPSFQAIDNPSAFSDSLLTRVLTYNYIYFLNLTLLIWPYWLCFDWSMGCVPLLHSISDVRVLFVALLYCYGLLTLWFSINKKRGTGKRKRLVIICLTLLVVPFLPATNLLFSVGFVLAERILYIPSAGFCLLVTIGFDNLVKSWGGKLSKITVALYSFLLLTFALRSWQRSYDWQNEYNLFVSGLDVCPLNAKVHYNAAKAYDANGEINLAFTEYKEAIRLHPKYYQAMNNLANLLKNQQEYSTAESHLRKALQYKKDFPAAWMNLAIVLANTGRYGESREAYMTALRYRRNYPDCYYNLGNLYLEMKMNEDAIEAWNHAINLQPQHTLAWSNLLALLDNTGQTQRALQIVPAALAELPDSPSIHFIIANIHGKIGEFKQAEKYFLSSIKLFGNRAQAIHYANLGVLYHRWKNYTKAEEMYIKALQINPDFKSAQNNLVSLRKLSKISGR